MMRIFIIAIFLGILASTTISASLLQHNSHRRSRMMMRPTPPHGNSSSSNSSGSSNGQLAASAMLAMIYAVEQQNVTLLSSLFALNATGSFHDGDETAGLTFKSRSEILSFFQGTLFKKFLSIELPFPTVATALKDGKVGMFGFTSPRTLAPQSSPTLVILRTNIFLECDTVTGLVTKYDEMLEGSNPPSPTSQEMKSFVQSFASIYITQRNLTLLGQQLTDSFFLEVSHNAGGGDPAETETIPKIIFLYGIVAPDYKSAITSTYKVQELYIVQNVAVLTLHEAWIFKNSGGEPRSSMMKSFSFRATLVPSPTNKFQISSLAGIEASKYDLRA